MIEFSDGETFDVHGQLRAERRADGWYVVGEGMLIPVDSLQEAQDQIELLSGRSSRCESAE